MRNTTITISKDSVYEEVAKTTAYIGAKAVDANGKNLYDQVFVTEADKAMLEGYWSDSIKTLVIALQENVGKVSEAGDEEGNVRIVLGMPGNWNENLRQALAESCKQYAVNKILADWCTISHKDTAETYTAKATEQLREAGNLLYARKRPTRNH